MAFLQGSPLWTGPWGHHIHLTPWQNGTKGIYQFIPSQALIDQGANTYNPIPDWGHILYSRVEMRDYLINQQTPAEDLEMILDAVYNDDVINRESAFDIIAAANASDLAIIEMEFDRVEIPNEVRDRLRARYPDSRADYSVMGVRMILHKD